jgi:hypothetical protein
MSNGDRLARILGMETEEFRGLIFSEHFLEGGLNVNPGGNWEFATRSD